MVSLRRRKLLGLCSGKSSFIAPLPRFFNGITPEISTHNSNHVRVHPVAPANVNQPVGILSEVCVIYTTGEFNRIGPGSSNGSGSSSSKEQPIQPVAVGTAAIFHYGA
uniref:Uncharacterized protein n=1 Tax=Quercus lobata TaxID=97700 RepID=A0A7N2MMM9_QUELO